MRQYHNLPPGVSPADIEDGVGGEDEQMSRIHAEGWLTSKLWISHLVANPYQETGNEKWMDTPCSMWLDGYFECDEDIYEKIPSHTVKLKDDCPHAYAGQVVRVLVDDEDGIYVWPGRPHSVRYCPEEYIENEWRVKPSRRELEKEIKLLKRRLNAANQYVDQLVRCLTNGQSVYNESEEKNV